MKVAIIGSGNVGGAVAQALRRSGHQVMFGVRSRRPDRMEEAGVPEAAERADVSILAIPLDAAEELIRSTAGFAGKILIDATNPLGMVAGGLGLTMEFDTSGAERIVALAPGAHVFKTFNQTGFENMADSRPYAMPKVMFVAGDAVAAKPAVMTLVRDAGFEAVDAGDLRAARLLEPFAMLWIELARKRGLRSDFAFSLSRKA